MLPGVVLAGGKSSRMGRPKALLPTTQSGETFLDRITRTLLEGGVDRVLVVVGADAAAIAANATPHPSVTILNNPDWEQGQLTSLLTALRHVDETVATGVVVTLIDVPLVTPDTVRALVAAHRTHEASIVRPVAGGRHGHPVIFHRRVFEDLRRADRSQGAKSVVRARASEIHGVPVDDEGAFVDIDTLEEYERWIGPLPIKSRT